MKWLSILPFCAFSIWKRVSLPPQIRIAKHSNNYYSHLFILDCVLITHLAEQRGVYWREIAFPRHTVTEPVWHRQAQIGERSKDEKVGKFLPCIHDKEVRYLTSRREVTCYLCKQWAGEETLTEPQFAPCSISLYTQDQSSRVSMSR